MTAHFSDGAGPNGVPVLRVVAGSPTDAELAALLVVLTARQLSAIPHLPVRKSAWATPERRVRQPVHASVGGWRASAFPR